MKNVPAIVPLILIILSGSLSAQVDLKFKFSDGEKQALEYRSTAHQILTLAGMDIETKSYTSVGIDLQYGMRDKKGRQQVTQQARSVFTDLSLPGGIQVTFDSANPKLTHDIPQIQAMMELWDARSRSEFVFMLDANNTAIEVTGGEALLGKLSPMAADLIRSDMEPTQMLEAFNREVAILSDTSVKTGDLWTRKKVLSLGSGQYLSLDVQYEYRGETVRDGTKLHDIGMSVQSADLKQEASPSAPLRIVGSALEVESLGGMFLFDANRGVLVESKNKMRITGSLSFTANGQPLSGKLDLTMEQQVLTNLQTLELSFCENITDAGLVNLKDLTNLATLGLGFCEKITGEGLAHLKGLINLQTLILSGSENITGAGLVNLKGLTNLQELDLSGTTITDAGLVHLKNLNSLLNLYLSGTPITDAGLVNLKDQTDLETLRLGGAQITDGGLTHLKGLVKLETLGLTRTKITDAGLAHLKELSNLKILDLTETKITNAGLIHLKGPSNLEKLDLNGTKVTDSGVKNLQEALPGCKIKL